MFCDLRAFYDTEYIGETIEEEDFPRLQARAEDAVLAATFGRSQGALPAPVERIVKKAVCAQIEWLALNGAEMALGAVGSGGFTVGHVTVQSGNSGQNGGNACGLCEAAVRLLAMTGLMYGGGVLV